MENEAQFANYTPQNQEPGPAEPLAKPWWEMVGERLDLGMFHIAGGNHPSYLNPTLRDWLGFSGASPHDDRAVWESVAALTADPRQVIEEVKGFSGDGRQGQLQYPLKAGKGSLRIFIYPLADDNSRHSGYGAFLAKDLASSRMVSELVRVVENLLVPARQISAAVQGNLGALSGNLHAWSPEVLDQFLEMTQGDTIRLRQFLDLGLSYARIISQTPLLNQPVSLLELVESIVDQRGFKTIKIHQRQAADDEPLQVKIDQAMVKVALETLLREVVDRSPPGRHVELDFSQNKDQVLITVDSPRMLPLPGLAVDAKLTEPPVLSPELFLAKEILTAQGGDLIFERREADEGGGLEFEISLPIAEPSQQRPGRQSWKEIVAQNTGRILLAEAQPEYQLRIREALTELGYRVDLAVDGNSVLDLVQTRKPNLVVLARDLPGMDGLMITQGLRRWSAVPILMISSRDTADDLLNAYRSGVDDYLRKPFLIDELLAKIQVFLSRQEAARKSITPVIYQEGSIRIDHGARQVWVRGEIVELTPIEYNLLVYLSRQGRQIVPYQQLLENVWEGPEKGTRQGLFVHVRRLREKIEQDPKDPQIISNKWGVGYEFNP